MSKTFLLPFAILLVQALACSGGADFTTSASHDAGGGVDASGTPNVVANPVDHSNEGEAGTVDATAGLPSTDASVADAAAYPGDATPDALGCSSSGLACDGGCVPNDVHNCGACGTVCMAPANGTATCNASGSSYACGASCNTNYSKCGGACVDTQSDSNNCGTCGHSCLPGSCGSGKCEPWVVTVDDGAFRVTLRAGLAADDTNIVWTSFGTVKESPVRGGTPFALVAQNTQTDLEIYNLAMASGVVAWTITDPNGGIDIETATEGMANSASGAHLVPNSSSCTPYGLALTPDGFNAYFILDCTNAAQIYSCNLTSFACDPLTPVGVATSVVTGNDVALANGLLFWTDSANGYVNRYSIASQQVETISISQDPFRLAVDSAYVYWASMGSNSTFAVNRALQSNPQNGGIVVAPLNGSLAAKATDAADVYLAGLFLPSMPAPPKSNSTPFPSGDPPRPPLCPFRIPVWTLPSGSRLPEAPFTGSRSTIPRDM